jgi:hypothetical protein
MECNPAGIRATSAGGIIVMINFDGLVSKLETQIQIKKLKYRNLQSGDIEWSGVQNTRNQETKKSNFDVSKYWFQIILIFICLMFMIAFMDEFGQDITLVDIFKSIIRFFGSVLKFFFGSQKVM